jgi:hypothetical protein
MDAAKKTQLEKRIVLGLAVALAVVFVRGPLMSLGLFQRAGGAAAGQPAGSVEGIAVTKSIGGMLREGWDKLDQQVQSVAARSAPAPQAAAAAYTAFDVRDPLKSLLPKPAASAQASWGPGAAAAEAPPPPPPELHVEGLLWGGANPQAIIDGRLYGVQDAVYGAKILAIDRSGVTIEYLGKPVVYPTASSRQGSMP